MQRRPIYIIKRKADAFVYHLFLPLPLSAVQPVSLYYAQGTHHHAWREEEEAWHLHPGNYNYTIKKGVRE